MMKFLDKLFPQTQVKSLDTKAMFKEGTTKEHPKVAELRAQAKAKMEQWGRKGLLEGGEFSLNNTVLNRR